METVLPIAAPQVSADSCQKVIDFDGDFHDKNVLKLTISELTVLVAIIRLYANKVVHKTWEQILAQIDTINKRDRERTKGYGEQLAVIHG